MSIALQKLLSAFYSMGQKYSRAIPEDLSYRLADIVEIAGDLSRHMRRCGDAVYHWPPTFKDGTCLPIGGDEPAMIPNAKAAKKRANGFIQRSSTQTAWNASTSAT